jgi:hypothetical protein
MFLEASGGAGLDTCEQIDEKVRELGTTLTAGALSDIGERCSRQEEVCFDPWQVWRATRQTDENKGSIDASFIKEFSYEDDASLCGPLAQVEVEDRSCRAWRSGIVAKTA